MLKYHRYLNLIFINLIWISIIPSIFTFKKLPLVISTWRYDEANEAAWISLNKGNSGLDALVDGINNCEITTCMGTVGIGGTPDQNGETTLESMLIDGATMNVGAVAGLREFRYPVKIAKMVLENTKHSLLVGDAAGNFAEMMGFQRESLSSPNATLQWQKWRDNNCQPNWYRNVEPDPSKQCGPYKVNESLKKFDSTEPSVNFINEDNHDTIGMIVIDFDDHIYAGTSTNGIRFKIPGRVGDSAIPGAGAYAENGVGAAVSTGNGDITMRFSPSFLAVELLRRGLTPKEAAFESISRMTKYYSNFIAALVVADRWGNYSVVCVGMKTFAYSVAFGNDNTKVMSTKCIVS